MKRVLAILMMVLFSIPMLAQQPKIYKERDKKKQYAEYKMEMEMGGNIKTSSVISTLDLKFYYYKHYDGYNNKGQMFFIQKGYNNCAEELENGKKTIGLILKVDDDTLMFKSTYWAVNFWNVNGVISERPDRYMNYSFYDIYDADIERLLNARSIEIVKFGGYEYENAGWYFTEKNMDDLKYFMKFVRSNDPTEK